MHPRRKLRAWTGLNRLSTEPNVDALCKSGNTRDRRCDATKMKIKGIDWVKQAQYRTKY
jgi:hypothetical protein